MRTQFYSIFALLSLTGGCQTEDTGTPSPSSESSAVNTQPGVGTSSPSVAASQVIVSASAGAATGTPSIASAAAPQSSISPTAPSALGSMAPALTAPTGTSVSPTDSAVPSGSQVADATAPNMSASATADAGTAPEPPGPLTVYIAGDSTVSNYADTASTSDQAGWGQMIGAYYTGDVTIDNHAVGGRTARRFIDEGFLDEIAALIQPGDYLLVQFGTNDGNKTATYELQGQTIPYYLDPATDFKTYLKKYLEVANSHQATLVFVTPPPRNSAYCTGGNGTGAHAQAMRELGAAEGVAVSDLNQKSVDYLTAICPAPTPEDFFLLRADGTVDGTHFQENGARILARLVAEGIAEAQLPLALLAK
jgi:lysophospholipase L1-like esterase